MLRSQIPQEDHMCGIAGYVVKRDDRPIRRDDLLDDLLRAIDHRGGDATGFVARNSLGETVWHKASCDARQYIPRRPWVPFGANAVVGHTRMWTNGSPAFPENNHPIKRGAIYVTHNGVITNDRELFVSLERNPFGEVDSEVIAAGLSAAGELGRDSIPLLESLQGSAAIAALDDRDGTVLLARVSYSPLYVLESRRLVLWASEASALVKAHTSAIGSLGRLKPAHMDEGDAILLRGGQIVDRFTFKPHVDERFTFKPSGTWKWTPSEKTAGSCSLPPVGGVAHTPSSTIAAIEAEDRSPLVRGFDRCDICADPVDDLYDLYDGHDMWSMCVSCWDSFAADLPEGLRRENGDLRIL